MAAAAVVGSILVHADGVDFTLLESVWFAVGLFVALPGIFGVVIGVVVDRLARPSSWTARGRRRWLLPVMALCCVPFAVPAALVAAVVLCLWLPVRRGPAWTRLRATRPFGLAVRSVWLAVAIAGLSALLADILAL